MEVNHLLPPSNIPPLRAPSAVGDGDAGPNSPYYRGRKKKRRTPQEDLPQNTTPQLEGSTSHIDIRV